MMSLVLAGEVSQAMEAMFRNGAGGLCQVLQTYLENGAETMSSLDQARETQLKNIQAKTGKTLAQLRAHIAKSGLAKHGEIRAMLMKDFGLGYGDANSLVHFAKESDGQSAAAAQGASPGDVVDEIYTGAKAPLRPVHDKVMAAVEKLGAFEIAPKKGYLSLRRKKQFAMVGPGAKGRLEVGLNMKGVPATARLLAQPPGGMCQYKVFLTTPAEVDAELRAWLKQAYAAAE
jgi:hypothetical protein